MTEQKPRTRVLIVSPVYPPATGGIETLTSNVVSAFDDCDVSVSTLAEPELDPVHDGPISVRRYRNRPRGGRRAVISLWFWSLRDALNQRPDVVVSMHTRCSLGMAFYRAIFRSCTYVQYFHAKEIAIWPRLSRMSLARADVSIAVSRYTKQLLERSGGDTSRVVILPPGVQSLRATSETPVSGRTNVLAVGRMAEPYKGFDVLLDAWAEVQNQCPRAELVIIGDGTERSALEAKASRLARVRFLGAATDEVRDHELGLARVFALPSRTSSDGRVGEGFGIVFVESAARGVPVVGANQGGVVDAVADGETGFLVDPHDPSAVADAIVRLLTDDDLADAMSANGAQWAERFSVNNLRSGVRAAAGLPVSARKS